MVMPGRILSRRRQRGFTLIELMIALVLLAILTSVGVPSYRSFILNQRLQATSADMRIALTTARSEAVKRNRTVQVLPAAGGWGSGWRIPSPVPGDPDLLTHVQTGDDVSITPVPDIAPTFRPTGRVTASVDFTIRVGPESSPKAFGCMKLGLDGRLDSTKGEGGC